MKTSLWTDSRISESSLVVGQIPSYVILRSHKNQEFMQLFLFQIWWASVDQTKLFDSFPMIWFSTFLLTSSFNSIDIHVVQLIGAAANDLNTEQQM